MEGTKIVNLLRALNKTEMDELEKFIASPYFSRRRDCLPLFKSLRNFYPEFGERASNKAVYEKTYTEKKYGDAKSISMLSTMSCELYKLGIEFLRYSELEKDDVQKKLLLLKSLRSKNLQKEFEKELGKAGGENPLTRGSTESFLESYRLNTVFGEYAWDREDMAGLYNALLKRSDDALAFALITAYKFMDTKDTARHFNIKTGRTFADIVLESLNSEKMLAELKNNNESLYPYIYANHLIYMMNKEPQNHEHYNKLKKMLENSQEKFGHTEKYMLYQALETYLVVDMEISQQKEAAGEIFDIYKNALKLGVHKVSPQSNLEPTVFRNIFTAARDVNELEWAEEFINKYSAELPEEFAEGMKDYAMANLHFTKGEFEKALGRIVNINYDYPLHKIDAKVLQFKIYYELGNIEQAFNILDTTKHYLNTDIDINVLIKERNSNFVKLASELLKVKTGSRKDAAFVLEKLKSEKAVESRVWLIEKMEEMINM